MHLGGVDGQVKGEKFRAPRPLVWAIVRKHLRGMTGAEIQEVYGIPDYVARRWWQEWKGDVR